MIAYVFWHYPLAGFDGERYESSLIAFQQVLAEGRPEGWRSLATVATAQPPWMNAPVVYEDWYVLDSFAALGALNDAAVNGARQAPHDLVAAMADGGAGGVYRLLHGDVDFDRATHATWIRKPSGMPYQTFRSDLKKLLPARSAAWQRQMALGPAREFVVHTTSEWQAPSGFDPLSLELRLVHAASE